MSWNGSAPYQELSGPYAGLCRLIMLQVPRNQASSCHVGMLCLCRHHAINQATAQTQREFKLSLSMLEELKRSHLFQSAWLRKVHSSSPEHPQSTLHWLGHKHRVLLPHERQHTRDHSNKVGMSSVRACKSAHPSTRVQLVTKAAFTHIHAEP